MGVGRVNQRIRKRWLRYKLGNLCKLRPCRSLEGGSLKLQECRLRSHVVFPYGQQRKPFTSPNANRWICSKQSVRVILFGEHTCIVFLRWDCRFSAYARHSPHPCLDPPKSEWHDGLRRINEAGRCIKKNTALRTKFKGDVSVQVCHAAVSCV